MGRLYAATGIAAYHVYLQAFVIRDWRLPCLGAAVTLDVFTDLACPHCAQFETETLPGLMAAVDRWVAPEVGGR